MMIFSLYCRLAYTHIIVQLQPGEGLFFPIFEFPGCGNIYLPIVIGEYKVNPSCPPDFRLGGSEGSPSA